MTQEKPEATWDRVSPSKSKCYHKKEITIDTRFKDKELKVLENIERATYRLLKIERKYNNHSKGVKNPPINKVGRQ